MEPIIVIVGPTGVGKTKLSVALAKILNAEIINGDSMQVYRGLDIGTAKVKKEEMEGIPHHLFDIVDVNDEYTVFDYQRDCRKKIEEITGRGKRVIIVGGTGLYIKAALFNYQFKEGTTNASFSEYSNEELLNEIRRYDPSCTIHVHNRRRLVRLLNKYQNAEPITSEGNQALYPALFIGLTMPREELYESIDARVLRMIQEGLLDEVKTYSQKEGALRALHTGIGYKEFFPYLEGKATLEEVIQEIQKNSRHYAKRQYTFFRHQLDVTWFEVDRDNFQKTIEEVITYIKK